MRKREWNLILIPQKELSPPKTLRTLLIYKYSPVYQYVYQDKKYLKISPSYAYREEGELGACGEILIDPSQPKDAILPEETSKDEYIIGAVLFGIFAVMLLIYLLTML